MRKGLIFAAVAAAALGFAPAGATVDTSTGLASQADVSWSQGTPSGWSGGWLRATRVIGGTTSNTTVSPNATFQAEANTYDYVYSPCCTFTSTYYAPQVVSPTALSIDPIGNSATINVTLTPTSGPLGTFNVTLDKPTYTSYGVACLLPCVNPWVHQPSNTVHADHYQNVGINRYGYTPAGTVPSGPLPAGSWGATYQNLGAYQAATLP